MRVGAAVTVDLTWPELMQAALVGIMRHVHNLRGRRRDAYGAERGDGWGNHIEGAAGELAVAKQRRAYWAGEGVFRGDDVPGLQVRTRSEHRYELIVRPDDCDAAIFVLVTGRAPHFDVRGWITGAEAKQPEFWKAIANDRPAAYFVPATRLHKWSTLPGGRA
jgi:hypothetical protein